MIGALRSARRLAGATGLIVALGASLAAASPAAAEVNWQVRDRWAPTHLSPGGEGLFVLLPTNAGDSVSAGTIKLVDQLPAGVSATGFTGTDEGAEGWACSGTSTVTCESSDVVGVMSPGDQSLARAVNNPTSPLAPPIFIEVAVSALAGGEETNKITMSGGGVATPAVQEEPIAVSETPLGFGVVPGGFKAGAFAKNYPSNEAEAQAGGHPADVRVNFDFNLEYGQHSPAAPYLPYGESVGRVRTVKVTLPRGLVGNPEAAPKCSPLDFLQGSQSEGTECPANTQVGFLWLELGSGFNQGGYGTGAKMEGYQRVALYNLVPPKGTPVDFGFQVGGFVVGHIYATLDPAHDYAIESLSPYIPSLEVVRGVKATLWGVPGDPAHDNFRLIPGTETFGAHFEGAPIRPLFTMPSDCGEENGGFKITADSWNEPGNFTPTMEATQKVDVSGCEDPRVRFEPRVDLQPTSRAAGGPTGLRVDLEVPQREQVVADPSKLYPAKGSLHGVDTPPMKKAVVTLPEGMTLSTAAAQGLSGCTPAQIGLGTNDPAKCPDSSQYGTLTLHTPILPKEAPMQGHIYIAQQSNNPFGTFLAMYLVIEEPERGLLVKLPGRIDLDPTTGRITTTFDNLPQFAVSDVQLDLKGGVRAGLVNPATCGQKKIEATFYSWHEPNTPITESSSYDITQKPDGSACVNNLAERQFQPGLEAGTVSPSAGSYSPFVFRLTRTDEDQELSQLGVTLPPGLSAKIAGIAKCPDAGIAQAEARIAAGDGALEESDPSCPASSQIGTTDVGSGVGQVLTFIGGKAYLAGPYKGAPLSMVVITPILAGPYDLGVIAVRSALEVNPETTQVTVKTDPFPQIYQGIPVRIRDIRVMVDRPETTINPTSCDPMQITAHVTGVGGNLESSGDDSSADLSQRFQAANCAGLGFQPSLSIRLSSTKRGAHPALRALVRAKPGNANIADTAVTLPRSGFLDQGHIRNVCTRVLFAAHECPAGSVYGYAKAWSPLLDEPLEGPVYLRSAPENKSGLPDLVAALHGPIDVDLVGHIDSVKFSNEESGIRTTFATVPDAPVTKFVLQMKGGAKGLIQNSEDLCAGPQLAAVRMMGQNGKANDFASQLKTGCPKARKRHKRGKGKGHKRIQARKAVR